MEKTHNDIDLEESYWEIAKLFNKNILARMESFTRSKAMKMIKNCWRLYSTWLGPGSMGPVGTENRQSAILQVQILRVGHIFHYIYAEVIFPLKCYALTEVKEGKELSISMISKLKL